MTLRIACLGDVVGRGGRNAIKKVLPELKTEFELDLVIANGENAAGGIGLDTERARELLSAGINLITLGDHTWNKKDLHDYLRKNMDICIRPANYPEGAPGRGWTVWTSPSGHKLGLMNLMGRVFINSPLDCPFRKAREILEGPLKECRMIICDLHAEATSEKVAMGRFLDGRISLLFGTHTHVQTADEDILPGGTAYISDLGMCGGVHSVIGMEADVAVQRFLTGMPLSYQVAEGEMWVSGIFCEIEEESGKALRIERIRKRVKP